jgi:AbrB family looped-hinge helix DNA binding protein
MEECHITLTERGQVTIPQAIRTELGLRSGDRIVLRYEGEQTFKVQKEKARPHAQPGLLNKYLDPKAKGVSVAEMNHTIAEGATRGFKS